MSEVKKNEDSTEKMRRWHRLEHEFMEKVSECGGFDIEHLMESKPGCCNFWALEVTEDEIAPIDTVLYARFGIHKYNMMKGTNLQFHGIEKYNEYCKVPYSIHHVTAVAKNPAAGGSLVTFQTSFYENGFDVRRLTCVIARLKPGQQEEEDQDLCVESESDTEYYTSLPEWPGENAFDDKKHYYVLNESEIGKYDWISLYLELAFYTANMCLPNLDLSKLVIIKAAVYTSDESISLPNDRLNARKAIFYIKYKYHGCQTTPDRIAIIRRNIDKFSGEITLTFVGPCKWRFTLL